jgi:hypothetical protein
MVAGFAVLFDIENHLVSLPRFGVGVALTAAGYSTSVAVLISIYSKVLEGLDQVLLPLITMNLLCYLGYDDGMVEFCGIYC